MTKTESEQTVRKAKRTKDIDITISIRSSVETLKDLNHLCDMIITCVLSDYEVVLVEKEWKELLRSPTGLKTLRIVLQEPPESEEITKVSQLFK